MFKINFSFLLLCRGSQDNAQNIQTTEFLFSIHTFLPVFVRLGILSPNNSSAESKLLKIIQKA